MISRLLWGVAVAVLPVAAHAAPDLLVAKSPHFQIYSAEDEAGLRAFAENLERYDGVLRRMTGASDAEVVPLTIYVLADQDAVGGGSSVIGFYQPVAAGAFAVVPRKLRGLPVASLPRIVLFNEYAHHFMLQHFPALYSRWFVEGAAEFYSTIEFSGSMAAIGKPEPLRIGRLMSTWRASLDHLLAHGNKAMDGNETEELYAGAWLLVHYLTLSTQRGGQIDAYIRARSAGQTEEQAFQSTFHMSIAVMNRELKKYFAKRTLPFASVVAPETAPVTIRAATPGEVVLMRFTPDLRSLQTMQDGLTARVSTRGDSVTFNNMAGRNAGAVRKAARNNPDDASMQELAAESELIAGNVDAARESATNAVRLQPRNARAHLVLAAILLGGPKPDDPATLLAARREIAQANRAAPDDPMPDIAYYRSFADHKQAPPALAVQALQRAYQLAPQDEQIRLMLAGEEIKAKRYGSAADFLRVIAFAPHPGPRRDAAQQLLNSLPGFGDADRTSAPDKPSPS